MLKHTSMLFVVLKYNVQILSIDTIDHLLCITWRTTWSSTNVAGSAVDEFLHPLYSLIRLSILPFIQLFYFCQKQVKMACYKKNKQKRNNNFTRIHQLLNHLPRLTDYAREQLLVGHAFQDSHRRRKWTRPQSEPVLVAVHEQMFMPHTSSKPVRAKPVYYVQAPKLKKRSLWDNHAWALGYKWPLAIVAMPKLSNMLLRYSVWAIQ